VGNHQSRLSPSDALTERDRDGDRERAVSLLNESLAISRDLGMRPLMERVVSRREHGRIRDSQAG
jgi:hypothetical protein